LFTVFFQVSRLFWLENNEMSQKIQNLSSAIGFGAGPGHRAEIFRQKMPIKAILGSYLPLFDFFWSFGTFLLRQGADAQEKFQK
jgi:hypothetical protein